MSVVEVEATAARVESLDETRQRLLNNYYKLCAQPSLDWFNTYAPVVLRIVGHEVAIPSQVEKNREYHRNRKRRELAHV